jgi:hypothetical protein
VVVPEIFMNALLNFVSAGFADQREKLRTVACSVDDRQAGTFGEA